MFRVYLTAAVSRFVGQHVVVDVGDGRLPGDEGAAVVDLAGRQVLRCVHGCGVKLLKVTESRKELLFFSLDPVNSSDDVLCSVHLSNLGLRFC